jgi:NAD(P)-dependent dehydrogenase (short-subunit alcohol dehydrogenase family)
MGSGDSRPQLEPQNGKLFVITGANSGIGFVTALELGRAGGDVVVCARDKKKADDAIQQMQAQVPSGKFEPGIIDLADLSSVRRFAETFNDRAVDVLINNAGVMNIPTRELTKDGFEMQIGTNFVGHYALSILMLPALRRAPKPRVVNLSSIRAQQFIGPLRLPSGEIDLVRDPAHFQYNSETVYNESKGLNLVLNNEMARRCPDVTFVACHPGVCATNLFRYKWGLFKAVMQSPEMGALGSLRAATDPNVKSGETYLGPDGWKGVPKELTMNPRTRDPALAAEYFAAVEKATGIKC